MGDDYLSAVEVAGVEEDWKIKETKQFVVVYISIYRRGVRLCLWSVLVLHKNNHIKVRLLSLGKKGAEPTIASMRQQQATQPTSFSNYH